MTVEFRPLGAACMLEQWASRSNTPLPEVRRRVSGEYAGDDGAEDVAHGGDVPHGDSPYGNG